ncbi:hypothetical protein HAX54_006613, partial [Datura stramonium]|nr:hypothetical protein [Datura stramonium]
VACHLRVTGQDQRNAGSSAGEGFEASGHCSEPAVHRLFADHDRRKSYVVLEGYKFNLDNCPDLWLGYILRVATYDSPLESL